LPPSLLVPTVSQDVGSDEATGFGAAAIWTEFAGQYLPTTFTTTNNVLQTALSYTGKGTLLRLVAVAQVAAATSTAAGVNIKVTIDGTVVYTNTTAVTANNRMRCIVGSMHIVDPTPRLGTADDPVGWAFHSSLLIEAASVTSGQGITVGWRVGKKR
jgi:hypothetical protein